MRTASRRSTRTQAPIPPTFDIEKVNRAASYAASGVAVPPEYAIELLNLTLALEMRLRGTVEVANKAFDLFTEGAMSLADIAYVRTLIAIPDEPLFTVKKG